MAVSPIHGKGTRVLCDEKDLSPFLKEVNVSVESDASEITTFGDSDREFIPGIRNATLSFDGMFSASTTPADDIINYLDGALGGSTKQVFTIDVNRSTGGRAWLVKGDASSYDISSPVEDIVTTSLDVQASEGFRGGRMLRPLAAATSTGSNSSVNLAGSTSAGGSTGGAVAHLHVTAASTVTSIVCKVQHSTSGSTWADAITFSAATAETFQRSTYSGTVKEKTRATISTFTGGASKSASIGIGFARQKGKS